MWRLALVGLTALLPGCAYVSSPVVSFGGFIGDTHWIERNPNRPVGASENELRVTGRDVAIAPLDPEPGNIWPGPQAPDPTLADLERQQNGGPAAPPSGGGPQTPTPTLPSQNQPPTATPGQRQPRPGPRGSSTPPSPDMAVTSPPAAPGPGGAPSFAPAPTAPSLATPQGPVQTYNGGNNVTTYQAPGGGLGIVVPNGNGTNTLVGPDGSVQTVPSRR